jgi:hypothetical protein
MTKCERTYELNRPLDDALMEAVARAHGVYGIQRLKVNQAAQTLSVGWDASRLSLPQVESILAGFGFPLKK